MQSGIGLLMTVLIITVPPIAAAYFQGTLDNFMSYSVFAAKEPGKDLNSVPSTPPPNNTCPSDAPTLQHHHPAIHDGCTSLTQDQVKNQAREKGAP